MKTLYSRIAAQVRCSDGRWKNFKNPPDVDTKMRESWRYKTALVLNVWRADPEAKEIAELPRYVSWIKRHKQGRVFFCSPAHNAQSFEQPTLLQFILGGIQYATGDLECPDSPLPSNN